jgi:hypothetical protein
MDPSEDLRSQLGHLKSELSFLHVLNGFNMRNSAGRQGLLTSEMTKKGEHYFNLEVLLMLTLLCTGTWLS